MRASFLAIALFALPLAAQAQSVPTEGQQRLACMGDAFRLCPSSIPDRDAIISCLAAQRPQLSAGCRPVFEASYRAMGRQGRRQ